MRWEDERYVRLYTRDTSNWVSGPWQARATLPLVVRKLDRAGILELDDNGVDGLAAMIGLPAEVVEVGLAWWQRKGTLVLRVTKRDGSVTGTTTLVMPNYIEAQECSSSDRKRAREHRERVRSIVTKGDAAVTIRDADITNRDATVTTGHEPSHGVTPYRAVPSRTVPDQDPPLGAPTGDRRASGTRGSRLAADWTPSEATVQRFRKQERVDALAGLERFRNHWLAKSGRGSAKLDWERTFVNWVLEDIARGRATPSVAADEWQPESAPDPQASAEVSARAADLFATLAKSKKPDDPVDDRPSGLVAVGAVPARKPGA